MKDGSDPLIELALVHLRQRCTAADLPLSVRSGAFRNGYPWQRIFTKDGQQIMTLAGMTIGADVIAALHAEMGAA